MKYNLIIPSVGTGSRFVNMDYKSYKPFIDVFGKRMIDHVADLFPPDIKVIIIAAKSKKELFDSECFPENYSVLFIDDHKNGPAFSIQKILHLLESEESYFVSYNDIKWNWNFSEINSIINNEDPDGIVFTHFGFHPHLYKNNFSAFCKTEENKIIEIREKASFTDNWMNEQLSVGAFFFKNKDILSDSINSVIDNNLRVAGEYYPSIAFNYLISSGLKVVNWDVSNFVHWGVPEQLKDVLHWERVFNNENQQNGINICLMMCGTGERMKIISDINKAGIAVAGIKMYKYVLQRFNSYNNYLIVNDTTISLTENELNVFNIHNQTNSQTESLKQACPILIKTINTIFTSNDCFGFINFDELSDLSDADIVLFGFKPSLLQQKQDSAHTYFETDKDSVTEILIKTKSATGYGLAGMFYVPDGKIFNYLSPMDTLTNPSFDHFAKYLLDIGKKIKFTLIDDYVHLGTPEELKEFVFWQEFYENNK